MTVFIIYFILFAFWSQHSLGFELEQLFGFSMGLSLKNISFFFLLLAWFLSVRKQQRLFLSANINKYIVLLVCVVLLSILPALSGYVINRGGVIHEIVKLKILVNPWIFFFFIAQIFSRKDECRKSIWGLITLLMINVVISLLNSYGLTDFGSHTGRKYTGRVMGFTEANQYAAFIVLLLPQLLSSSFLAHDINRRIAYGFLLMLCTFCLFGTISRGGYVAFMVSLSIFFFLAHKKQLLKLKNILLYVIIFAVGGISIYILVPEDAKETFNSRVLDEEVSALPFNPWQKERSWVFKYSSGRTKIWSDVINVYLQKPVLGLGLAGYKAKRGISTHNEYLKYLVDHGIFGLFFYLMICIGIIRYMYQRVKECSNVSSLKLYIGYIAGAAGFFTAMFTVNIYETQDIFWIYTAVMYKYASFELSEAA